MQFGIIYNLVSSFIHLLYKLNLVEWSKVLARKFTKKDENEIRNIQISIDIFILLKFAAIILIWNQKWNGVLTELVIWYLIVTNVFTYFYYHVWIPPFQINNDSKRRRFVNLFISFIFSNLCFAVLYSEFYFEEFKLKEGFYKELSSGIYSSYNSLFASYEPFTASTDIGYIISLIQLSITFIFISIILGVSIPQLERQGD